MCEEELFDEWNKLEIAPVIPQIKLMDSNLPVLLNPFYSEASKELPGVSETNVIFGDVKCSCRMRRRSESVLDDCKIPSSSQAFTRIEHTIKNVTQFKHRNRKKVILREPILKSLQKCLHPRHLKAFGHHTSNKSSSSDGGEEDYNKSCPTIEALNLDDTTLSSLRINSEELSSNKSRRESSGITDFRDLIAECQSLLESNFNVSSWNASIASRKNLKNFNVIQSTEKRSQKPRNRTTGQQQVEENPNREEEQGARHCSASTSCSQQARISTSTVTGRAHSSAIAGTSTPCDVTIDELASYFETFVHIPKKMSTMAEMMYI